MPTIAQDLNRWFVAFVVALVLTGTWTPVPADVPTDRKDDDR